MSTYSLMNIGASALTASQAALSTAGHNIANVNTAGYSRQQVLLTSRDAQMTSGGMVGRGVDVTTVTRTRSQFLTTGAQQATAMSSADAARADSLKQLETLFPVGDNGLGAATTALFGAFSDMQSMPNDTASRTTLLARADELASRFRSTSSQLDSIQTRTYEQIGADVTQINSLAGRIAAVNEQIARYQGTDHSPNDLLDQRDQLVTDLNKLVQTTTIPAADGTLGVFIAGGHPLVLATTVSTLKLIADPTDSSQRTLVSSQSGRNLGLSYQDIGGGELAGLLRFQSQDLTDARNQVGYMALAVANVINNQVKLGMDQSGTTGTALFTLPTMAASGNAANTGAASVKATVNDPTGLKLKQSDYQIDFTSGTAGTITRLSDGVQQGFAGAPATVNFDGLDFALTAGAAAGDRFMLKPGAVGASITVAVTSPQKMPTTPVAFEFGTNNTGSLAVSTLRGPQQNGTSTNQTNPYLTSPVTLTFTAVGPPAVFNVVGNGTGNPTGVLNNAPGGVISYNGWQLTLSGTPAVGDVITLKPLSSLGETHLPLMSGNTLNDAYANIIAEVGTQVQGAQSQAKLSSAIATEAQSAQTSTSGVNLDEEAAKLLQYQQSYQASAKILQVAQTIFDTLLSTVSH